MVSDRTCRSFGFELVKLCPLLMVVTLLELGAPLAAIQPVLPSTDVSKLAAAAKLPEAALRTKTAGCRVEGIEVCEGAQAPLTTH